MQMEALKLNNNFYLDEIIEKLSKELTYKNVDSMNKICLFLEQITTAAKLEHITLEQADAFIDKAFTLYDTLLT